MGYRLDIKRQTACLVFNPVMIDIYAIHFNYTRLGGALDSMTVYYVFVRSLRGSTSGFL